MSSFTGFLALGCFFGLLPAAGIAAALAAGSIASAFTTAAQILGKGFLGRSVASVPLAEETAK
jgi:hypothetical protein